MVHKHLFTYVVLLFATYITENYHGKIFHLKATPKINPARQFV